MDFGAGINLLTRQLEEVRRAALKHGETADDPLPVFYMQADDPIRPVDAPPHPLPEPNAAYRAAVYHPPGSLPPGGWFKLAVDIGRPALSECTGGLDHLSTVHRMRKLEGGEPRMYAFDFALLVRLPAAGGGNNLSGELGCPNDSGRDRLRARYALLERAGESLAAAPPAVRSFLFAGEPDDLLAGGWEEAYRPAKLWLLAAVRLALAGPKIAGRKYALRKAGGDGRLTGRVAGYFFG